METGSSSVEWDAVSYHRLGNPQYSWGRKVLARLAICGDETAIDAGCGTGRLTAELLERLPRGRVIAIDQSENMLRVASEHLTPRFGDRVSFVQADLLTLEMDMVADLIFSTATFHWVLDQPRLYRNLRRALRPGGRLVAQCGGGPNLARITGRAAVLMESPPYARFFAGWPGPWEYVDDVTAAARLRAAGFVDVETSLEPALTTLATVDEYRDFLASVIFGVHLARVPDEELRARFVETLTEQGAKDDPPFLLDYWRLNLRGRRPDE